MNGPVKVIYMGLVRNTLGISEEEVELPAGSRVRDLLSLLQERHGAGFQHSLFTRDDQLRPLAGVFIGEQNIQELNGMDTEVGPDSGVYILVLAHSAAGG